MININYFHLFDIIYPVKQGSDRSLSLNLHLFKKPRFYWGP